MFAILCHTALWHVVHYSPAHEDAPYMRPAVTLSGIALEQRRYEEQPAAGATIDDLDLTRYSLVRKPVPIDNILSRSDHDLNLYRTTQHSLQRLSNKDIIFVFDLFTHEDVWHANNCLIVFQIKQH